MKNLVQKKLLPLCNGRVGQHSVAKTSDIVYILLLKTTSNYTLSIYTRSSIAFQFSPTTHGVSGTVEQ